MYSNLNTSGHYQSSPIFSKKAKQGYPSLGNLVNQKQNMNFNHVSNQKETLSTNQFLFAQDTMNKSSSSCIVPHLALQKSKVSVTDYNTQVVPRRTPKASPLQIQNKMMTTTQTAAFPTNQQSYESSRAITGYSRVVDESSNRQHTFHSQGEENNLPS